MLADIIYIRLCKDYNIVWNALPYEEILYPLIFTLLNRIYLLT
jgi:hypothetical protein